MVGRHDLAANIERAFSARPDREGVDCVAADHSGSDPPVPDQLLDLERGEDSGLVEPALGGKLDRIELR